MPRASESAALEAAAATSGRAVAISGLTVMTAMAGMFLTGDGTFSSFAMATILVVAIAVLGSLTVLPALLSWLGDRVNKARVEFLQRLQRRKVDGCGVGSWTASSARPLVSAVAATAVLVALRCRRSGMKTVVPGLEALRRTLPAVQTYNRLQQAFPGEQDPAVVVVEAPSVDAQGEAVREARSRALMPGASTSRRPSASTPAGRSPGSTSIGGTMPVRASVMARHARDNIVLGRRRRGGVEVDVTGTTAAISKDFDTSMRATAPLVFAFVLAFAFVLLLVSFRSIVLAVGDPHRPAVRRRRVRRPVLVFQHSWAKGSSTSTTRAA